MAKKIAINGFGRIGRLTLRNLLQDESVEVVAVNDLTNSATLAHLFKYDSAQGTFDGTVEAKDNALVINGKTINTYAIKNPAELPWGELGVDIVLECTGIFRKREQAQGHIEAGAKRVILSAPAKTAGIPTIVRGINDSDMSNDTIMSNASCTTNCLAPMVKLLEDNYTITQGFMNTIHAYTGDQSLVDAPHSDLRRARAAAANIIPTSTGAAAALKLVVPEAAGKIAASSLRVPVPTGSLVELVVWVEKAPESADAVNAVYQAAAESNLKGILEYCTEPIVSSDIVSNPHSCIFDSLLTIVEGNMVKISGWYDNEAGYSARLAEMAAMA